MNGPLHLAGMQLSASLDAVGQYISLKGQDALPVTVTVDGHERLGYLEAWRQDDAGNWSGYVRWAGPDPRGYTSLFVGWFAADDIKPDEPTDADPATAGDA